MGYPFWNYKKQLSNIGITLQGDAISTKHSSFYIQEWKVMLDAGLSSNFNME